MNLLTFYYHITGILLIPLLKQLLVWNMQSSWTEPLNSRGSSLRSVP